MLECYTVGEETLASSHCSPITGKGGVSHSEPPQRRIQLRALEHSCSCVDLNEESTVTNNNSQIKRNFRKPYIGVWWNYFNWFGEQQDIEFFKHFLKTNSYFNYDSVQTSPLQEVGASKHSLHMSRYWRSHYGWIWDLFLRKESFLGILP